MKNFARQQFAISDFKKKLTINDALKYAEICFCKRFSHLKIIKNYDLQIQLVKIIVSLRLCLQNF